MRLGRSTATWLARSGYNRCITALDIPTVRQGIPFSPIVTSFSTSTKKVTEDARLMDIDTINKEYKQEIETILSRAEEKKLRKQEIVGYVSSAKAAKTITVTYYHDKWIPKYNVHISTRRKIMAHDEEGVCSEGDMVRIVPCRPISKRKRFKFLDMIKKANKLETSVTSKTPSTASQSS